MTTSADAGSKPFLFWTSAIFAALVSVSAIHEDAFTLAALPFAILPMLWYARTTIAAQRELWIVHAMVLQYLALYAINMAAFPTLSPDYPVKDGEGEFIRFLLSGLLLLSVPLLARETTRWPVILGWGVVTCFVVLAAFYIFGFGNQGCRVEAFNRNPLYPPIWMTAIVLALFGRWIAGARREIACLYGLVFICSLSAGAFSGARTILLIQMLMFPAAAFLLGGSDRWRHLVAIGATIAAGVTAALLLDAATGCNLGDRIGKLVEIAQTADLSQSGEAELGRFETWTQAIALMPEYWLQGRGFENERYIVIEEFGSSIHHLHNLYLSWLMGGGIAALLSGLVFLFGPPLVLLRRYGLRAAWPVIALVAVIGLNGMTTILFYRGFIVATYMVTFTALLAMVVADGRKGRTDPTE
ncbi:O-antigen ligase family protein [Pontivivens ytuae]|uniref:O-antigen ligase family protein n=1 Tax=Pontivivens ytuae TaxID=2789856 RepID=A0A7S9QBE9_9RHOB|nr:O-antigen ligase family protein [Pontivivens ytuae]QPH52267.1 O-antigen ligase family protein [Pontivivens ytuae]